MNIDVWFGCIIYFISLFISSSYFYELYKDDCIYITSIELYYFRLYKVEFYFSLPTNNKIKPTIFASPELKLVVL